jgi:hypothetical protein
MPLSRSRDHHIHLVSGAAPVAVRPYRCPTTHKDKLEHQSADMLA